MAIIGRIISTGIQQFRSSCTEAYDQKPGFGDLIWARLEGTGRVYAVITDLTVSEDALIEQIAHSANVDEMLLWDNRRNRVMSRTITAVVVGFTMEDEIQFRLPPHPPAVLEPVQSCSQDDVTVFYSDGNFDYVRHLITPGSIPHFDLLAAHIFWVDQWLSLNERADTKKDNLKRKLNTLLQDDPECYIRLLELISSFEKRKRGRNVN
jgi:hypothetical protein